MNTTNSNKSTQGSVVQSNGEYLDSSWQSFDHKTGLHIIPTSKTCRMFSNLNVNQTQLFQHNGMSYNATKVSSTCVKQVNNFTQTLRYFIKSSGSVKIAIGQENIDDNWYYHDIDNLGQSRKSYQSTDISSIFTNLTVGRTVL